MFRTYLLPLLALTGCAAVLTAQPVANYSEDKVPAYTLPNPLHVGGTTIKTAAEWERIGRPKTLALFEQTVFGTPVPAGKPLAVEVLSVDKHALNGLATRKQINLILSEEPRKTLTVLLYYPNSRTQAVPMFVGLNFNGNHTVSTDPGIILNPNWTIAGNSKGFKDGYATEASRGSSASRWPLEDILKQGYGVATAFCGDIQPDRPDMDNRPDDFYKWFSKNPNRQRTDTESGTIGMWAWGLSRILDYLEQDKDAAAKRVAVVGHSRLGKAALWAGALDKRFALIISNDSGEGGAAITRRSFGETIQVINTAFPHWFSKTYRTYNNRENDLPVDFHQLLALMAPRPLYVASATEDLWADPRGEFLSLYEAGAVYKLYGKPVLPTTQMPAPDAPIRAGVLGYHLRTGKHDITPYDWSQFLNFANAQLK